jgi:hypothetical protein
MGEYRTVSLPVQFRHGLELLTRRVLLCETSQDVGSPSVDQLTEAAQVVQALFGSEPVFGQLQQCDVAEVRAACQRVGVEPSAELAPKAFVMLLRRIEPATPVCSICGELPLNDVGGKLQILGPGYICPFCGQGQLQLIPIILRRLAWTSGHLVDPGTDYDLQIELGKKYPLQDEALVVWAGDVHPELLQMLVECQTSIYAFLAYLNLQQRMFKSLSDAVRFLCDPHSFGISKRPQVQKLAREARAFVAAREVTNLPASRLVYALNEDGSNRAARILVNGQAYLIEGRLGEGDKCLVLSGYREAECPERVVIKMLTALDDEDLLRQEAKMLRALQHSEARGSNFFRHIIPEFITLGGFNAVDGLTRPTLIYRQKPHFEWTLFDVQTEYPTGVDAQTAVWMWNRLLTLLAWLQLNNVSHGAILPQHVLLHIRNHAATLLDWSSAVYYGHGRSEIIPVVSAGHEAFYPDEILHGEPPTAFTDLAMSARCILAVSGGDLRTGRLPDDFPTRLGDILRRYARLDRAEKELNANALYVQETFRLEAKQAFGAPRYHEVHMPRQS